MAENDLLDISVVVHLTVDTSEWAPNDAGESLQDAEISNDVAKDIDIAVRSELFDIVTEFAGYDVVHCERRKSE